MAFETALKAVITSDSTLNNMIGGRVRPISAIQNETRPYIAYEFTDSEDPSPTFSGPSNWERDTFDMVIVTDTFSECENITPQVKRVCDGFVGTIQGVRIAPMRFQSKSDIQQERIEGKENPIYVRMMTFRAQHRVAI